MITVTTVLTQAFLNAKYKREYIYLLYKKANAKPAMN